MSGGPNSWMPMYWSDFLADTIHLKKSERDSYFCLIAQYWLHQKPLPLDDGARARMAQCTETEWKNDKKAVLSFFKKTNKNYTHKRIDFELKKAKKNYKTRKQAAKTAAKSRWKKKKPDNASRIPDALQSHSLKHTQPQPQPPIQLSIDNCRQSDPPDFKKKIFGEGLDYLAEQSGRARNGLRPMVGKWLKQCSDDSAKLWSAIESAQREEVAEPIAWITARLGKRPADDFIEKAKRLADEKIAQDKARKEVHGQHG